MCIMRNFYLSFHTYLNIVTISVPVYKVISLLLERRAQASRATASSS